MGYTHPFVIMLLVFKWTMTTTRTRPDNRRGGHVFGVTALLGGLR